MGKLTALDLAESVALGEIKLQAAMEFHLCGNFYPPHPSFMVPVALEALKLCREGKYETRISLPNGVTWRDGKNTVSASNAYNAFRLDSFD